MINILRDPPFTIHEFICSGLVLFEGRVRWNERREKSFRHKFSHKKRMERILFIGVCLPLHSRRCVYFIYL